MKLNERAGIIFGAKNCQIFNKNRSFIAKIETQLNVTNNVLKITFKKRVKKQCRKQFVKLLNDSEKPLIKTEKKKMKKKK